MPSSRRSRAIAERQDRDVTRIASKAVDPLGSLGVSIRTAVLRAVRRGGATKAIINRELRDFVPIMTQAMTAAYVMGQYQSKRLATKAPTELARNEDVLGRWAKIVGFAEKRAGISKEALGTLFEGFEGQASQAMKSMGGVLEAQVRAAVAEATRQGLHFRGTEELVRKAFDDAGMTNAKPWLIETQARTQTQLAYSAGMYAAEQDEAIQEIIWGREYVTVGDDRVRPSHAALDGLRLPVDHPRWKEILPPNGWNCFAPETEVEASVLSASKALYSGPMIQIETRNGRRLTVTPNHPVATLAGWKRAADINEGDYALSNGRHVKDVGRTRGRAVADQYGPTRIDEVFDTLRADRAVLAHQISPLDLHGDAASVVGGKIDVVRSFVSLMNENHVKTCESSDGMGDLSLVLGDEQLVVVDRPTTLATLSVCCLSTRVRHARCHLSASLGRNRGPAEYVRFGEGADTDVVATEEGTETPSTYSRFLRQLIECRSLCVTPDEIVSVRRIDGFRGHVYDLETRSGFILTNGIISHNCRCTTIPIYKGDDLATINNVPKYVTVDGERVRAGADEGFDFDPIGIARELGV